MIDIKIDTSQFDRALADWRRFAKKDVEATMREQARGIIKRVVSVTPPASGTANADARKAGEGAVKVDLAKLFVGVALTGKRPEQWPDLAKLHDQARNRRGRVNRIQQPYHVDRAKLAALQKLLIARVGMLAAGWNASAARLGLRLPAWISRHGVTNGQIEILTGPNGIVIRMTNSVKFAAEVEGYVHRIQWAVNAQARAMARRTEFMYEKLAKRCRF